MFIKISALHKYNSDNAMANKKQVDICRDLK